MLFSYNWLKSFFKKPIPAARKLAEILNLYLFEVENLEKKGKDYIFDIAILANRSDCFSHLGLAREISAILGLKLKYEFSKPKEKRNLKIKDFLTVEVKDKKDCPRYTARVILGVRVGPSPEWIRERIEACGLRSINNIVDITNYVMLEMGQPLHAFDYNKLSSSVPERKQKKREIKKILVRKAKNNEKIITLDNETIFLKDNILIIADTESPLAIAGIKGGKKAEISPETKDIILESANFDPALIYKTSKSIGLETDASLRFAHKIDRDLAQKAIDRTAFLIQKIAGGEVVSGLCDISEKKKVPREIRLNLNYLNSLLGVKIPKNKVVKILKSLEFNIKSQKENILVVKPPSFRLDISLPEDVIEEVGRIYGVQKIPAVYPLSALVPPKKNYEIFWENEIKDIMKNLGFSEVYNYSFLGEREPERFGFTKEEIIEIENPVSSEQKYLRPNLLPNLLKNVKDNFRYFDEVKIFEIGKIFKKDKNGKFIEKRMVSGVLAQKQKNNDIFYYLKGAVDSLFERLGISSNWYDDFQQTPEESKSALWHPLKSAEIKVDSKEIGFLGEISPYLQDNLEIKGSIAMFEIEFNELTKFCSEEQEYQPISQYPSAVRDLAVLVPRHVKVVEVLNKINSVGGKLIRDIDLFDIYEGEEIPEGKKNLAFHIVYQAEDRTLTSEEIDNIQKKIIRELERDPEWEVRR